MQTVEITETVSIYFLTIALIFHMLMLRFLFKLPVQQHLQGLA